MNKKRIILFPALALILLCAPVCSNHFNTQTNVEAAAKVKLNARHKTILKGKKYQLKLKNNKKKIKWTSSNKKGGFTEEELLGKIKEEIKKRNNG